MIPYLDLSSAVAGNIRVNYNPTDLARFQVEENLNAAQRHLLATVPVRFLSEAIKTVRTDLVSGIPDYQWPSDFVRFLKAWVKWTSGSTYQECEEVSMGGLDRTLSYDAQPRTSFPKIELNAERGFYIKPAPKANCSEGIRLRYIYQLPAISEAQNSLLDVKWKNLLVFKATALSALVEGSKPDLAQGFEALFSKELERLLPKSEES